MDDSNQPHVQAGGAKSSIAPRDYASPFKEMLANGADDKDKVSEIRKGYYPLIARIMLLSVILDFLLLVVFLMAYYNAPDYLLAVIIFTLAIKVIALIYYTIFMTFKWTQTYFQFDGHTLVKYVGIYNPQQTIYNLNNLYTVDAHISVLGRILKYGHITLIFIHQDGEKQKVLIPHVIEPMKAKQYFAKYLK